MSQPSLHVESLTVSHGAVTALRDVTFTARSGEITALIGNNGAGKSSLLRAIIGLASSKGDIFFQGDNINHLATEDRIRAGLALVPEGRRVFPGMTVEENLLVGGIRGRAERTPVHRRGVRALPTPRRPAHRTGPGSCQEASNRCSPLVVPSWPDRASSLLDEPSLGLSPRIARDVAESLKALTEKGAAVVIAEPKLGFRAAHRRSHAHPEQRTNGVA